MVPGVEHGYSIRGTASTSRSEPDNVARKMVKVFFLPLLHDGCFVVNNTPTVVSRKIELKIGVDWCTGKAQLKAGGKLWVGKKRREKRDKYR